MGPLDAFWHLLDFFLPALWVAALAAAAAKGLLWRRELAGIPWQRLVLWPALAGAAVLIAGLVITGHDGRMATYAVMVLAAAVALWWVGFAGRGR
jgi:hypothetical protein